MGATATHQKQPASIDCNSSSPERDPIKEKTCQKQRRKTFGSLGIRGSFDLRGSSLSFRSRGSLDMGSSKSYCQTSSPQKQIPNPLSDREKVLLTETWKELEGNIAKVGVITFVSLFETHPDVQEAFMSFRGIEIQDLKQSKELRAHALRVMAFVQKAIARLNEPEKLEVLLKDLGRKHVSYGAKQKYVGLVGSQFIVAIKPSLEGRWNQELHDAWFHLFKIVEYVMVGAMDEEEAKQKKLKDK